MHFKTLFFYFLDFSVGWIKKYSIIYLVSWLGFWDSLCRAQTVPELAETSLDFTIFYFNLLSAGITGVSQDTHFTNRSYEMSWFFLTADKRVEMVRVTQPSLPIQEIECRIHGLSFPGNMSSSLVKVFQEFVFQQTNTTGNYSLPL